MNFTNVSDVISFEEFEQIKAFILKNGDKMIFRNFDNNNPHYKYVNCDVFLGADIGQRNINNDPDISDFNQLTIKNRKANIKQYELIIVRKGDLNAEKQWIKKGMEEEQIYLVDDYDKGLELLKNNLPNDLKQIKDETKNY
ncbi:hypothetical protein [Olleya sp. HaHaR_3_96]|nr:hypothetical protein [Olleya sp. HaHaR_3_96]QXP58452.1 hypothetical protein H0I26_11025 [Olleya sp. HaHaR_3_96]